MPRKLLCGTAIALLSTLGNASENDGKTSIGPGLGIPYGGLLGVNIAHGITDQLELSGALGLGLDNTGWSIGGRYFFTPAATGDSGFRASLLYGTNGYLEVWECTTHYSSSFSYSGTCESEYKSFEGLNLGLGWGHRAGESGWNIDLIMILTSGVDDEVDRLEEQGVDVEEEGGGRIKLSVGYLWAL